jgi:hypothetical protein
VFADCIFVVHSVVDDIKVVLEEKRNKETTHNDKTEASKV